MSNRGHQQELRRTLYLLKGRYGVPIDIYRLASQTTDIQTGVTEVEKSLVQIRKAIVLPEKLQRDRPRGIEEAFKFRTGGEHDTGTRSFLVDRRDATNLSDLTTDDWVVFQGAKYHVVLVEDYETDAGWIITATRTVGEVPEQIVPVHAESLMPLDHPAESE